MKFGFREAIFVALLMAIPIAAWALVFKPRNDRIAKDIEQIESKRSKLEALNRASVSIRDKKAEIEEINKAIDFFHHKLPQEKEMDKVVSEVWNIAQESRLATRKFGTNPAGRSRVNIVSGSGPYAEQSVSMDLEGDFAGLYNFLLALESKARIVRIHQMKLETKPNTSGAVSASLTMAVFYERSR